MEVPRSGGDWQRRLSRHIKASSCETIIAQEQPFGVVFAYHFDTSNPQIDTNMWLLTPSIPKKRNNLLLKEQIVKTIFGA